MLVERMSEGPNDAKFRSIVQRPYLKVSLAKVYLNERDVAVDGRLRTNGSETVQKDEIYIALTVGQSRIETLWILEPQLSARENQCILPLLAAKIDRLAISWR